MNAKQLLKLLILVVVVAIAGALALRTQTRHRQAGAAGVGGQVLPGLDVNQVAAVIVTDADGTVELRKKDGLWRVAQRDDYRADFAGLATLLRDLAELKAARTIEAGPSQFARLGLAPDAGGATELRLLDAAGKPLAELRLGKEYRQGGGDAAPNPMGMMGGPGAGGAAGRFLLIPKTGAVLLVAKPLTQVTGRPMDWVNRDFVKLAEVKRATLAEDGQTLWEVSRAQSGDPLTLAGLAKNEQADAAKLDAVAGGLSWLSFAEIAPKTLKPADAGLDAGKRFTAEDFDGTRVTLAIGKPDNAGRLHLAATAAYTAPKAREAGKDEKPADKEKLDAAFAKKQAENQQRAAELQERLSGRVFLVEKTALDGILRGRGDLLAEKPQPEAAANPGAFPMPPAVPATP
ncbi:MAG: DUF4340 domain-containing protein [Lentisphaeria bacterium]